METVRAALGDDANLSANGVAILSGVICREHLIFLYRVKIRNADGVSGGAHAHGNGAVIGDQVVAVAAAVDLDRSLAGAEIKAGEVAAGAGATGTSGAGRAAGDARLGERHINRV